MNTIAIVIELFAILLGLLTINGTLQRIARVLEAGWKITSTKDGP